MGRVMWSIAMLLRPTCACRRRGIRSMPSDTDRGVLRDILRHIELAERFTRGHTFETFNSDELHLYAVTRCLEVISEASRRLSDELKARHLGIPWKQMAG